MTAEADRGERVNVAAAEPASPRPRLWWRLAESACPACGFEPVILLSADGGATWPPYGSCTFCGLGIGEADHCPDCEAEGPPPHDPACCAGCEIAAARDAPGEHWHAADWWRPGAEPAPRRACYGPSAEACADGYRHGGAYWALLPGGMLQGEAEPPDAEARP